MAINSINNLNTYFKHMSNSNSLTSSLSPQTVSSLNSFVFSQMQNPVSQVQNMLSTNFSKYQNDFNAFASFQKDSAAFSQSFGDAASSLKSSASALNNFAKFGTGSSAASSSDSSVLSVTGGSLAKDKTIDINVQNLASGQTMQSGNFASSLGYTLGGTSSMKITAAGKTSTLSFNLSNSANNKDALTQMAGKINTADLGVKASVTTKNGMSSLQLESTATGADAAFSASFTGNAEKLNLQTVATAQDAIYTIDGTQFSSAKNEIALGNTGVKATLSGTGKATVSQSINSTDAASSLVKNFVKDYNQTVNVLKSNSGKTSAVRELAQSYASVKYQASALDKIGITTKSDGTLSVNSDKFASALKANPKEVKNTLEKLATSAQQRTQTAVTNQSKLFDVQGYGGQNFSGGMYNSYKQFYNNPAAAQNVINMML